MSSKDTVTSLDTLTGRVKWFNNKAGYGFITVTVGDRSGSDIFVHHSGINVSNQQYKYLVQGEYVDFVLEKPESGAHEFHAVNVNGINSGKLMCETRREFKLARNAYTSKSSSSQNQTEDSSPHQSWNEKLPTTRSRGEGPRETQTEKKEWTTVVRGKVSSATSSKPSGRGRGRPARTAVNSIEAK